jgi:hypothetical protein
MHFHNRHPSRLLAQIHEIIPWQNDIVQLLILEDKFFSNSYRSTAGLGLDDPPSLGNLAAILPNSQYDRNQTTP